MIKNTKENNESKKITGRNKGEQRENKEEKKRG